MSTQNQPHRWRMYRIERGKGAPSLVEQVRDALGQQPATHLMARVELIGELVSYLRDEELGVEFVVTEQASKDVVYLGRGGERPVSG